MKLRLKSLKIKYPNNDSLVDLIDYAANVIWITIAVISFAMIIINRVRDYQLDQLLIK